MASRAEKQPKLTRRERQVLVELCRPALTPGAFAEPASIRDIAPAMFVTEAAIKQHMRRLYNKFHLHDRSKRRRVLLANEVIERGIVAPVV
jgi:DNA-binding NarL/FixJ family response regulator